MTERSITWLHFSDLHAGVKQSSELWPRFKTLLYDDLAGGLTRFKHIDAIIFSGDLVQTGSVAEFRQFSEIVQDIFGYVDWGGDAPKLITVPGNHDLVRPLPLSPEAVALKEYWSNSTIRDGIWTPDGASYLNFLGELFGPYLEWRDSAVAEGWHFPPSEIGLIPGDASYVIKSGTCTTGVIGLSSAWLQLSASNYEGELHVDSRQLFNLTDYDPEKWVASHDANLLVTHHPASWLHPNSPATWSNDINPTGRFDLHLFGHMHEPDMTSVSHGGGGKRLNLQASSLLGLEYYGDKVERIQGYSIGKIDIDIESAERTFTAWPRSLQKLTDGRRKIVRDDAQDLEEATGTFSVRYKLRPVPSAQKVYDGQGSDPLSMDLENLPKFQLDAIQYDLGSNLAQCRVRRVETQACLALLGERRFVWLASDWGMGRDGFLANLRVALQVASTNVYSIDIGLYGEREVFLDRVKSSFGMSFQEICEAISLKGRSVLILNDVDIGGETEALAEIEKDIVDLVCAVADFAPDTFVMIHSRRPPKNRAVEYVELVPLDEADVALYAGDSDLGGERYLKPDAASILFRHTDGVPVRLDEALRDLEIVSLRDLITANPDYGAVAGSSVAAPSSLVAAISQLENADERIEQRSYELIVALSALPQGERVSRLKRFLGVHPFGPMHARMLIERSLVEASNLSQVAIAGGADEKILTVPRLVRDVLRDRLNPQTLKDTDRRALDVYFGQSWASGDIENSPTVKRVREALCDSYEIENTSTLIHRTARRALVEQAELEISGAIRLATSFGAALLVGDHFRSAAALSEDIIHLLSEYEGFDKQLAILEHQYARALRMLGKNDEARAVYARIDTSYLSRGQRQSVKLGISLCAERAKDSVAAIEAAREVIKIDRNSGWSLQAQVVLAKQEGNVGAREVEFRRILDLADKRKDSVVSNNIRLDLAALEIKGGGDPDSTFRQVLKSAKEGTDHYNWARAIIGICKNQLTVSGVGVEDKIKLIEAYHYLYNERLFELFDSCHEILWKIFEMDNDRENMLNLFRRSSFIWRLGVREDRERIYLQKLSVMLKDLIGSRINAMTRDGAYFLVRVTVVLGVLSDDAALASASDELPAAPQ